MPAGRGSGEGYGESDYGSPLLGTRMDAARQRRSRTVGLIVATSSFSTVVGGAFAAMLIVVGIPEPSVQRPELTTINQVAVPTYITVGLVLGHLYSAWLIYRSLRWTGGEAPPSAREASDALLLPRRIYWFQMSAWLFAAVLFSWLYGRVDLHLIPKVAMVILGVGMMTSGVVRVLTDFSLRPVTAIALRVVSPAPRHQSLSVRSLRMWFLGSGLPLLGVLTVALFALFEPSATVRSVAVAICVVSAGGFLSGTIFNLLSSSRVSAPVRSVTTGMRRVSEGRYDTEVVVYDGTSLGDLQSGFNSMAAGLRERERVRDLYARQVGEQVARATIERDPELGGVEQTVAVIFIDLVGSTALAIERPATEVVSILNRFCSVVVAEVNSRGGLVNKFEGDAVLAVFGAPASLTDPAGAALSAARAMMYRLAREVPEVRAGCGVTYGTVVAGYVGAADRFEYTVIGDPVNEAARLSTFAKADPTVPWATEPAVTAADPLECARWRVGPVEVLRGRTEHTRMYLARR